METHFTSQLNTDEIEKIIHLYESLDYAAIEQYPYWPRQVDYNKRIKYFYSLKADRVTCFARILESKYFTAHIQFGPVFNDIDDLILSLKTIYKHYKKKKFLSLTVQLGLPSGEITESIENRLTNELKVKSYDDSRNWSTSILNLEKETDQIKKGFSRNHIRSIEKAIKLGLNVRILDTIDEVEQFSEIFVNMYTHKRLYIDKKNNLLAFRSIFQFFQENNKGFFLGIFNKEQLIGGLIIVFDRNIARSCLGANNPEIRNIPVMHLCFYEAFKLAKLRGFKNFDMGGYNFYVDKNHPLYSINQFKDRFTKNYLIYPKRMYFEYFPFCIRVIEIMKNVFFRLKTI